MSLRRLTLLVTNLMLIIFFLACDADNMEVDGFEDNSTTGQELVGSNGPIDAANPDVNESIAAVLLDNGHTELIEALEFVNAEIYTQLVELFEDQKERHTLFAPSNEAFFKLYDCLGMKTQDISELDDPGLVRDILLYHVAKEINDTSSIIPFENEKQIETLYGKSLTVKNDRSVQGVGSIAIIDPNEADIRAKNGIVHVISEVLLPVELRCKGN